MESFGESIAGWLQTVDWPVAADVAVAGGTLILALFTAAMAHATRRLADEAERTRLASERPWLVAFPTLSGDGTIYVAVQNTGGSIASAVRVTAEFDAKIYDVLEPTIIDGSEVPPGITVERRAADVTFGAGRGAYRHIDVHCRWEWAEQGRTYAHTYRVDPGLTLRF